MTTDIKLEETYLRLGTEIGFDNVSLSMIAADNNISKATVFSHFESFAKLRQAALELCTEKLSQTEININTKSRSFEQLAQDFTDNLLDAFSVFPLNSYISLLNQQNYLPEIQVLNNRLSMMITARLTVALDFAVQHGWTDISDTDLIASIMTGTYMKLISQKETDRKMYNDCIEAFVRIRC